MPYTIVNPYCTLNQLKDELKRSQADVSIDDELSEAIVNASRWLDNYIGRDFFFHDYTSTPLTLDQFSDQIFDNKIILDWPILTTTQLAVGTTVLTLNTDWIIQGRPPHENRTIVLMNAESDGWHRNWLKNDQWLISRPDNLFSLTGTFGYAQSTSAVVPTGIPPMITQVTRLVAAAFSGHNRKQVVAADGGHTDSFPDGGTKVDFIDRTIPRIVYQMLGRQRALF
jgi:hypothetical protein